MEKEKSCIKYPCEFPLKVMGLNTELFEAEMRKVFETLVTGPITYAKQQSKNGKYVSITATFTAVSREQLDALYRALHGHKLVVMTL